MSGATLRERQPARKPGALPMPPIRLTDSELDAVMAAARPIPIERRDAFLQQVAVTLQGCNEIGPGVVYRVAAQVQREFFDPPDLGRVPGASSKYR
jgi:hypothetical protein